MISEEQYLFIKKLVKLAVEDDNENLIILIKNEINDDALLLGMLNGYDMCSGVQDIVTTLTSNVITELQSLRLKQENPAMG